VLDVVLDDVVLVVVGSCVVLVVEVLVVAVVDGSEPPERVSVTELGVTEFTVIVRCAMGSKIDSPGTRAGCIRLPRTTIGLPGA
jgi:hypothetical protein